jgi:ATP-dependent DNA helicase RecQ
MAASTGAGMQAMQQTLHEVFGLESLRPGQREIIESVMQGRDTLAIMPTGAGKSLCYQLPAMHLRGLTLVVSPLIALMKDQRDKLAAAGVDALQINSTLKADEERDAHERLNAATRAIVFVTPEQFSVALCQFTVSTTEQVAVRFPDGTTRTFLSRFVRPVDAERSASL